MKRWTGAALVAAVSLLPGQERKLTPEERIEILRGLTAEFATSKILLPRSKKPLQYPAGGAYDRKSWEAAAREHGPAARVGDLVQVSKVDLDDSRILLEINGGFKGGRKWYDRLEVGMGSRTTPVSRGTAAPGGTAIEIAFPKGVPPMKAAEVKKMLAPVLDFERRSATEQFVESLPPEIQTAIKEKRAAEGMDREQVLLAMGRPKHKVRETKDGVETEDWVYGEPPGKIVFVTFNGSKVASIREAYAGLGGAVTPPLPPR